MKRLTLPTLLGLAHGASDAAAGFLIARILLTGDADGGVLIMIYNALAFGLQPLTGLMLDQLHFAKRGAALSLLLCAVGMALSAANLRLAILCTGIGSAFFHPGAGGIAIANTPDRASGPGVFAAFGVVGLAFGTHSAILDSSIVTVGWMTVLIVCAIAIWLMPEVQSSVHGPAAVNVTPDAWTIMLLGGLALRSFVWVASKSGVSDMTVAALWVACFAGAGKLLGGFLADQFGWLRWTVSALFISIPLLAFSSSGLPFLLAGVFLLQSATAPTLAWLGQRLSGSPSLAAGIGLGLAVIVGGLPVLLIASEQIYTPFVIAIAAGISLLLHWLALSQPAAVEPAQAA